MRVKKWLIVGGVIFIIIMTGAYIFLRTGPFTEQFRVMAVKELESMLGRKVYVRHIDTNFLNSVNLKGVRIAKGETFREGDLLAVDAIRIKVDLFRLISRKATLAEAIRSITLVKPVFVLSNIEGDWNIGIPSVQGEGNTFPGFKIFVSRGIVSVEDVSRGPFDALELSSVRAEIDLSQKEQKRIVMTARTNLSKKDKVSFDVVLEDETFAAELKLSKGNIVRYSALVNFPPPKYNFTKGLLSADLSLMGSLSEIEDVFYKGNLYVKDATLQIDDVDEDISNIHAQLLVEKGALSSNAIVARIGDYPFVVKGKVFDITKEPSIDLEIDFPNADYALLVQLTDSIASVGDIPVSGRGAFGCRVSGPLSSPGVNGSIRIAKGVVLNEKVTELETKFKYGNNLFTFLNLSTGFYGGNLALSGTIDLSRSPGALNFDLRSKDVNLVQYLRIGSDIKDMRGRGALIAKVSGDISSPVIEGALESRDVSLFGQDIAVLEGTLKYSDDSVAIAAKTNDGAYNLGTFLKLGDRSVSVKEFSVLWGMSSIRATGNIDTANRSVDISVDTQRLKVENFAFMKSRYKNIKGEFSFLGKVQGKLEALVLKGKVNSNQIYIDGRQIDMSSEFSFGNKVLNVSSLAVNSAYRARGEVIFSHDKKPPYVDADLTVEDGHLDVLALLLEIDTDKYPVKGNVSGSAKLKGPLDDLTGNAEIELSKAQVKDFPIEHLESSFALYDRQVNVSRFLLRQNGGRIKGTARAGIDQKKKNKLSISLMLEQFKISEMVFDGNMSLEGDVNYGEKAKGQFITSGLRVNGQPHVVRADLVYKEGGLNISPVSATDDITLKGDIIFGKDASFDVMLNIRKVSLSDSLKAMNLSGAERYKGMISGALHFEGTTKVPEVEGYLNITSGDLTGFKFDTLNTQLSFRQRELVLRKMQGRSGSGSFSAQGNIDFSGEDGKLDIKGSFNAIALESLLSSSEPDLRGLLSGTLTATNTIEKPFVSISLKGEGLRLEQYDIEKFQAEFSVAQKKIKIENLEAHNSGSVIKLAKGSELTILSGDQIDFDLLVGLRNITISGLSAFGGMSVKGKIDLSKEDTGVFADIVTDSMWVNQYKFERARLKLHYTPGMVEFLPVPKSRSNLIGVIRFGEGGIYQIDDISMLEKNRKSLMLRGEITKDGTADLTLKTENFDAGIIAGLMGVGLTVKGNTSMDVRIGGTKEDPYLAGDVQITNGSLGLVKFDTLNISAVAKDNLILIEQLSLSLIKGRMNVSGGGVVPFAFTKQAKKDIGEKALNMSISVFKSDLSFLADIASDIKKASGDVEAHLDVKGTLDEPVMNGYFRVKSGEIFSKKVIKKVSQIEIDMTVVKNKITINTFDAKIGEGYISMAGSARMENYAFEEFDVEFATSQNVGIDLSIDGFIPKGKPKMRLHVYGDRSEHHIDGDLELVNTHFTYPPQATGGIKGKDIFEMDFFKNAIWNVTMRAGDNTWYENSLVVANITGGLSFTGSKKNFKVEGSVETIKGDVQYLGVEFKILQAELAFQKNVAYLEGKGETKVDEDIITLVIEKTALKDIKPKFYSQQNPELSQEKVISLLIYGKDVSDINQDEIDREGLDKYLLREMLKVVDSTLSSRIIRPVLKEAGLHDIVDVVKVKTMIFERGVAQDDESLLKGSQVTLGKYFTNKVFVSYTTLFETGIANKLELRHQVELEYRIQGSKFLRMRMDSEERFWGLENKIRF
ncbi:MAG: translocation/assembly module TamB domain-containing protein [bacterium]